MFDDDLVYYPSPYERMTEAAKAENRNRIVSYNCSIMPRGTDFQDLEFGETFKGSPNIWPEGMHAHGCFPLDGGSWGSPNQTQSSAIAFLGESRTVALEAAERGEALSWNLLTYDDGSISERSLNVLRSAGEACSQAVS